MPLSGPTWLQLIEYAEYISISLSFPINLLLQYCIYNKSPKEFGNYKYLLSWFSFQSMFFSVISYFTKMSFHTYKGCFMMFTVKNRLNLPDYAIWVLLGLCCISVGYTLFILALSFLHRYWSITKNRECLKLFTGWRRLYIVMFMIIVALVYGGCGFVGINLTKEKDLAIRNHLAEQYNVRPDQVHYIAVEYFERLEDGTYKFNWLSIATAIVLDTLFSFLTGICLCYGVKNYQIMRDDVKELNEFLYIHRQLFRALLFQTLTPTILIFLPCIAFYVFPIFEYPLGAWSNILSISLVLYPVIDPLTVLFIIVTYRMFIASWPGMLCQPFTKARREGSDEKLNEVSVNDVSIQMDNIGNDTRPRTQRP